MDGFATGANGPLPIERDAELLCGEKSLPDLAEGERLINERWQQVGSAWKSPKGFSHSCGEILQVWKIWGSGRKLDNHADQRYCLFSIRFLYMPYADGGEPLRLADRWLEFFASIKHEEG